MIYFAKIDGLVKIGCSQCVDRRFKQHVRDFASVEFLFSIEGDRERERALHREFSQYHRILRHQAPTPLEHFALSDAKLSELKERFSQEPGFSDIVQSERGLTIYLDPVAHAALKAIAEEEDKLLQDLLKEGVNLVLQRYGKKPIA